MVGTRLLRFFIPMAVVVATLVAVCPAGAEVVALRRGAGAFGLFQNGQISPVFADKLPTQDGTGSNTITEITDASAGVNIVDDAKLWGGSDADSTGIPAPRGGGNTWDEAATYSRNYGTSERTNLNELSLLKFNVAQATGLIGGTIQKAELRLFFDAGFGPDPDDIGERDFDDQVGRIITSNWVEGNKVNRPPGKDDTNTGGTIAPAPPAPGVTRTHANLSNTGAHRDINNVGGRTRGRWFDANGVIDAGAGPAGEDVYRTLLGSDYNNDAFVDGADLTRWIDNFGSTAPPATGTNWRFPIGDDDMNGAVTGSDLLAWQTNAGKVGVGIFGSDNTVDDGNTERGWFGTSNPGGDVTYQAPSWGDGNDYFNPDPVDYTDESIFQLTIVDGVGIYVPQQVGGGTNANFNVSPNDGISPGDGDVANEVNSIEATSLFPENFDMEFRETENPVAPILGTEAGFDVWDVTQMVQSIADGADNFGFYVRDNLRVFSMSESANGLDFAPVLFIDYTPAAAAASVPEPSSTVLMGILLLGLLGTAGFTRNRQRACWARVPIV